MQWCDDLLAASSGSEWDERHRRNLDADPIEHFVGNKVVVQRRKVDRAPISVVVKAASKLRAIVGIETLIHQEGIGESLTIAIPEEEPRATTVLNSSFDTYCCNSAAQTYSYTRNTLVAATVDGKQNLCHG